MPRGTPFPLCGKLVKLVHAFTSTARTPNLLVPTHVHFVDLLSSYPLGRSFDSSSEEGLALLGVCEVLTMEDLEFPVLLDNSDDGDRFVGKRGPGDGSRHVCELRRGYMLWSETT
jgi:hypothetical protein